MSTGPVLGVFVVGRLCQPPKQVAFHRNALQFSPCNWEDVKKFKGALPRVPNRKPKSDAEHRARPEHVHTPDGIFPHLLTHSQDHDDTKLDKAIDSP